MKRFINLFLVLFTAIFLFIALNVSAQEGIKASPLRIEELVEPGQTITKLVKITNISDSPKTFYLYLMDFKARGETGEALLVPAGSEEGPYLASWIKASNQGIDFASGEEKQIPITFQVPENVGPGGYYGAIVFGPRAPEINPEEGAALALTHQVGVLALFHVLGDVSEQARVREFSTDKDLYSTPFNVNFLIRIENLGNVHIKSIGSIEIKNMFGKQIAVLPVNEIGANILPNSIRRFESFWQDNLGFGKYTASLILNFGTPVDQGGMGMQTISSQRSFWIMPWKIILPIFLGLIFIAALLALFLKIYKHKAIKKAFREAGLSKFKYVKKHKGPSPALYLSLIITIILILIFIIVAAMFFLFFA